MKRILCLPLVVWGAAAALLPAGAGADTSGLYGAMSGLYVMPSGHEAIPVELPVGDAAHDLGMERGAGGLAAFGYAFEDRWRGEIELAYRVVDAERIDGWTGAYDRDPLAVAGGFRTLSVMTNVYYRFRKEGFAPYLGAGIGVARHRVEAKSRTLRIGDMSGHFTFDGRDTVLAWQAMAGVARPIAENVELRLGYRFFRTRDGEYGPDRLGYEAHNLEAGLRFAF